MSTDEGEGATTKRTGTNSTSVRNLVGFFKQLETRAAQVDSTKSKRFTTNFTSPVTSPRGHKPAALARSSGEIQSARGPSRNEIVHKQSNTSNSLDMLDLSISDRQPSPTKFKVSSAPEPNNDVVALSTEHNTSVSTSDKNQTDTQLIDSPRPNSDQIVKGPSGDLSAPSGANTIHVTDTDKHDNETSSGADNRTSVKIDAKPVPDDAAFTEQFKDIKQSTSGSAITSPTEQLVESPSFNSLPDESRKRRSKSRGSGKYEKPSSESKKDQRTRSKSKTEGTKKKGSALHSSPPSGYTFKRREDVEKEEKKKRKEEEERRKKEEDEIKRKKKEEDERRKKEEKEAKEAAKRDSDKKKSRRSLVPSLSLKAKDKDDAQVRVLSSRDSKDDLHIRSKSSVADERGRIKPKKSMPSLKFKSISPRGDKKNAVKESRSIESSHEKLDGYRAENMLEPRSEQITSPKTERPRTRSLHRSASNENVELQTRTARNTRDAPEPLIPTPDGATTFRVRKRSLSTNELKGDGTDAALSSTEPISLGQKITESKQREDTYVNLLKKSIREILLGTNMKIEREELTKIRYEEEASSSEEDDAKDVNIWDEPEDSDKNIRYDTRDETINQLLFKRAVPVKEGSRSLEIRCASLNKLVERLTYADYSVDDKVFMRIFLATFESFTTPKILFQKLRQRFAVPRGKYSKLVEQQIQSRVCTVMKYWIDNYPSRKLSKAMIGRFRDFINTELKDSAFKPLRDILDQSLTKRIETNRTLRERVRVDMTTDVIPPSLASNTKVYDPVQYFTEEDIASQITFVDYEVYNAVQPWEVIREIWRSPMTTRSPIKEMIQRFNAITNWAVVTILSQNTPKARAQLYSKFVKIARQLREMNNFNGVMAIIGALNNKAITRLSQTKSLLSKRTQKTLEKLDHLLNMRGNFRSYRELLLDLDPPAIPFMGLVLSDYTFIVDGNVNSVDGMINFAQRKLMWTNCLELLVKFQNASETDVPQHWAAERLIAKTPQWTDELAFERSCAIEPDGESVRREEATSISILAAKTTERSTSTENNERSEDLATSS